MRLFTTDDLFSLSNINLDKWTNTVLSLVWHDLVVQHGFLSHIYVKVA